MQAKLGEAPRGRAGVRKVASMSVFAGRHPVRPQDSGALKGECLFMGIPGLEMEDTLPLETIQGARRIPRWSGPVVGCPAVSIF
jgi:hypothetical protein